MDLIIALLFVLIIFHVAMLQRVARLSDTFDEFTKEQAKQRSLAMAAGSGIAMCRQRLAERAAKHDSHSA